VSRKHVGQAPSKTRKGNCLSRNSQLYQEYIFSEDYESEKAPVSKMEKNKNSGSFCSLWADSFSLHVDVCKTSYRLFTISFMSMECTKESIPINFLRENSLPSQNKIQSNTYQQRTVIIDKWEGKDPEIFKVTLGQLPTADQPQNLKEKYFESLDEGETRPDICHAQPHPSVRNEDDCSNMGTKEPHENTNTYFLTPLIEHSDENCAERIALTEIKSRSSRETIPKKSPYRSLHSKEKIQNIFVLLGWKAMFSSEKKTNSSGKHNLG